jgi:hypothetical protein
MALVVTDNALIAKFCEWLQSGGIEVKNVRRIVLDITFGEIPRLYLNFERFGDETFMGADLPKLEPGDLADDKVRIIRHQIDQNQAEEQDD